MQIKIKLIIVIVCLLVLVPVLLFCCRNKGNEGEGGNGGGEHACSYGEWVVVDEPSCTERGTEKRTCTCGNEETRSIDALGHKDGIWETVLKPTCTKDGLEQSVCPVCNEALDERAVPAYGHVDGDWVMSEDETQMLLSCIECGEIIMTTTVQNRLKLTLNDKGTAYTVEGYDELIDSELIIPAVYKNLPVTKIDKEAFKNVDKITSVTIPSTVTEIGEYAFYGCAGLESLSIGEGVVIIGDFAFYGCINLTVVNFNAIAMNDLAENNNVFTDAGKNGEGITLNISINVTVIPANLFNSTGKTEGAPKVEELNFAEGCKCEKIGEKAFYNCVYIIILVIPDSVTEIGEYAFYGCTGLESLTIGEGVVTIGDFAFYGCINLTVINFNAIAMNDLAENNNVFTDAGKNGDGITLNIGINVTVIPANLFNSTGKTEGAPKVEELNFAEGCKCEKIGDKAFYNCIYIIILVIPDSVTEIGEYAFYGCTGLESLTIGEGVVVIGDFAFYGCINLTVINFNAIAMNDLAENNNVFTDAGKNGDGITLNIGINVTVIPANLFNSTGKTEGAPKVEELNFAEGCKCEKIGDKAFYNCIYIIILVIPDSVKGIGEYAFYGCTGLESLTIGEGVVIIGDFAFYGCINLTVINFNAIAMNDLAENNNVFTDAGKNGDGITLNIGINVTVIPSNLFNPSNSTDTAPAIEEIDYADGCKCEKIGDKAFYNCIYIIIIKIPTNVVEIGGNVFAGCVNLNTLYYDAINIEKLAADAFAGAGVNGVKVIVSVNVVVVPESFFYTAGSSQHIFNDLKWTDGTPCIHPHKWSQWTTVTATTCTKNGLEERTCVCGAKEQNTLNATGHTEGDWIIDKDPTCTAAGSKHTECSVCSETISTASISATGHTEGDWIIDKDPTCTIAGNKHTECSDCNETISTASISATGHTEGEWVTSSDETKLQLLCSVCGEIIEEKDSGTTPGASKNLAFTLNDDGESYSVTGIGECADTDVVIPAKYNYLPVTAIGASAFRGCKSLTSITIPDSVMSIGDDAFFNCLSLTNITIPDSVTSIGNRAFGYCYGLTSITIPGSVTTIGEQMFYDCSSLTSVIITDGVTSIGSYAFHGCSSLTSITIPKSVKTIGGAVFIYCSSLTSITIPDSVTSIGSTAFGGCTSLTSITIPDSVTSIGGYVFSGCEGLSNVTIWGSGTTIGEGAFCDCTGLTSVTISVGVTSIGNEAFYNCSNLISITIPDSVTSIGHGAFRGCSSLTIYCEATSQPSGWHSNWNITSRPVVWGYVEVVASENLAFTLNDDGESYSVTGIGNCTDTDVVIPSKYNGLPVTSIISVAFAECSSLTSITIPDSVTAIGDCAFLLCNSLTSVTIPSSVTSIGNQAFSFSDSLANISVDSNNAYYKSIDGNLYTKDGKTLVQYAVSKTDSKFSIPNNVTNICASAFANCISLTSITIPDSVTTIGHDAFTNCISLTSITIPDSVTRIDNAAFFGCSNLTSITIPDSVTRIDGNAFFGCSNLTIYCEAESQPSGWDIYWNYSNCPVVWGYTGEE